MTPFLSIILILSIALQLSAAILALRLIGETGYRKSWIAISVALFLMSLRRLIPLVGLYTQSPYALSILNESLGLVLSFLMLVGMLGIKAIFTEKKAHETKIVSLLKEKDQLLKEVHHRVINNMTTIANLLTLQASRMEAGPAVFALEDAKSRVQSMMLLYNKLYQSPNFGRLSIRDYLSSLIDEILKNFPECELVTVDKELEDIELESRILQPLGIIVNELLTNIMKYAFQGRINRRIAVSAIRSEGARMKLCVMDNGAGLPASVDFEHSTGFGMTLIFELSRQLKAKLSIDRSEGTKICLVMDVPTK